MPIVNTLWGEEDIPNTKVCMVCKETKLVESFGLRSYHKDGTPETKNTCKSCLSKDAKILRNYQNKFAKKRLAILEGRDQGMLFKNADIKFFFKCTLKVAAKRRFKEFRKTNKKITLKEVELSIKRRNYTDLTRTFMPLRIPPGAVIVSTSLISKKEMFRKISKIVERKLLLKYGRSYKAR